MSRHFGAHRPGVLCYRAHEIDLSSSVVQPSPFCSVLNTAQPRAEVQEGCGYAAVHGADRVVVPKFGHALENRAAVLDLDQMKTEQFADGRMRLRAVDDALEHFEPAEGHCRLGRHHAVLFCRSTPPPRVG